MTLTLTHRSNLETAHGELEYSSMYYDTNVF
jgi:hypothetical protein